jgi:hypothetical protein
MKVGLLNIACLLLVLTACAHLPLVSRSHPDVSGAWSGTMQDPSGQRSEQFTLSLTQDGSVVSGTGVDEHGEPATINGEIHGTDLSLTLSTDQGDGTLDGTLSGDRIEGTWTGRGMSGPWWAERW